MKRSSQWAHTTNDHHEDEDARKRLEEIRTIVLKHCLVESDEELTVAMLEDLVHFAYFTRCISKREVRRLLGLTEQQTSERIRVWKRWQEGNRGCSMRPNPFYEGWTIDPVRRNETF